MYEKQSEAEDCADEPRDPYPYNHIVLKGDCIVGSIVNIYEFVFQR